MMVVLNILFLSVLAALAVGVGAAVFVVPCLILGRRLRWRKWRVLWTALVVSVVLVSGVVGIYISRTTRPDAVFQNEFGFPPPAGTIIIKADTWALGDSGTAHLHFKCNRAAFDSIVRQCHFTKGTDNFTDSTSPAWSRPGTTTAVESYFLDGPGPGSGGFSSEHRGLTYDPATGDAWYSFSGVD